MKRSARSRLIEWILRMSGRKKIYADPAVFAKFLKRKRIENAKPYTVPEDIRRKHGIEPAPAYGKDCYVLKGDGWPGGKTILYLLGGGHLNRPISQNWAFLRKIADFSHATMIVPIYPKAPVHRYHESYRQVLDIYEKLIKKTDPKDIVFMGDSAGGGFALGFAQWLKEKKLPQPGRIILISPWLDLTLTNPDIPAVERKDPILGSHGLAIAGRLYAGDTDPRHYQLSPINGDLQGLGEISVFIGTHDLMLADCRKFRDRAAAEGVKINYFEYPGMNHVFPAMPIPEARRAIGQIVDLIRGAG